MVQQTLTTPTELLHFQLRTAMTMDGEPMSGVSTDPMRVSTGRYSVQIVLAMTGNWQIGIDWDGPAGKGSVTFPALIQ